MWRAGVRWQVSPDASQSVAGIRREAGHEAAPEHGLMVRAAFRW